MKVYWSNMECGLSETLCGVIYALEIRWVRRLAATGVFVLLVMIFNTFLSVLSNMFFLLVNRAGENPKEKWTIYFRDILSLADMYLLKSGDLFPLTTTSHTFLQKNYTNYIKQRLWKKNVGEKSQITFKCRFRFMWRFKKRQYINKGDCKGSTTIYEKC